MDNENLISYCGLYCGSCFQYIGSVADMARDIRKELRKNKFDKVAEAIPFKEFDNYPECYQCLGAMVKLRCKGCRGGFRSKFCKIAKCSQKKKYQGCWECNEFETCKEFEFLKPIHKEANIKNLRKIRKQGVESFLKGKKHW